MSNTQTSSPCKPGDIIELAGIKFVVLDDLGPSGPGSSEHDLFIRALESQGRSPFGSPYHSTNDYARSSLRWAVEDWFAKLVVAVSENGLFPEKRKLFKSRIIDLTTTDKYKGFGTVEVSAAPLTMEESRKYAGVIPDPDEDSWLANGWAGPGKFGSVFAMVVRTDGFWMHCNCANSRAIHPALVISTALLAPKDAPKSPQHPADDEKPSSGIIRRLDSHGCVEIPNSILHKLDLLEGDPLEIVPMEDGVFLRIKCPIADELERAAVALHNAYPHADFFSVDKHSKILSHCAGISADIQTWILRVVDGVHHKTVHIDTVVEGGMTKAIIAVPIRTNRKTIGFLVAVSPTEARKEAIINTMRVLASCIGNRRN